LAIVIAQRQRIVARTSDAASDDEENGGGDADDGKNAALDKAQAKTTDYGNVRFRASLAEESFSEKVMRAVIPYTTDAQANAATKNPQLKLMFRLVHCHVRDDEGERSKHPSFLLACSMEAGTMLFFFPPTQTKLFLLCCASPPLSPR
jgi:replication fork protection complex subunit Tof1/Swi1